MNVHDDDEVEPGKVYIPRLRAQRRSQLIGFLRHIAKLIEDDVIEAEAGVVVTSDGDVHQTTWQGYNDWELLGNATHAAHDAYWDRRHGREPTPEDDARRRAFLQRHHAEQVAAHLAAYPFPCACGERFKTERGLDQHINRLRRHPRRVYPAEVHAPAEVTPPVPLRALPPPAEEG